MSRNRRSLLRKRRPRQQQKPKLIFRAERRRRQAARSNFDFWTRLHGHHKQIIWEWQTRNNQHRRYATDRGKKRLY